MASYTVAVAGRTYTVAFEGAVSALINGVKTALDIEVVGDRQYSVLLAGQSVKVVARRENSAYEVLVDGVYHEVRVESERSKLLSGYARSAPSASRRLEIRAPMPALVVKIEVNIGDEVKPGAGLLVLEAMKMENELKAHVTGRVREICAMKGRPVEKGELLMVLE